MKICLLFCFSAILYLGCKNNDNAETYRERFNIHRKEFESLLSIVKNNPFIEDSLFNFRVAVKATAFPPAMYERLFKLGITDVYLHAGGRRKHFRDRFVFQTNWDLKFPIIVANDPDDSVRTIDSYCEIDENKNEFWGLGNSWMVYKEVKAKEMDQ